MWTEERLRDYALTYHRAHAERYEKRVSAARGIIREAFERVDPARCYAAWSGGKDSTVMAHMVNTIARVDVVTQVDDLDFPDKMPYAEMIAERFQWKWIVIRPEFSVVDYMLARGIGVENICAQTHDLTKIAFLDLFANYREQHGKELTFLGLRAKESSPRSKNRMKRGLLYRHKKDNMWIATPLGDWDVWDVWAYHVLNEIPIRPFYLQGDPATLRSAWLIPPERPAKRGAVRQLKNNYPGLYNRLVVLFPELKEFT